jgi:hypothetical protein
MVSDKKSDIDGMLDRIMLERLKQFDVPKEVRDELKRQILALFQRPENKRFGATVMTVEASMAADVSRKEKRTQEPGPNTPKVI